MADRFLYLYCATGAGSAVPVTTAAVEGSTGPLRAVAGRRVAVVVSPLEDEHVRLTPRSLEAHQEVVEAAHRGGTVLPFRFGLVVEDEDRLRAFLRENELKLAKTLLKFRGLAEVRITARYVGDSGLRAAARSDPRIGRMRDRLRGKPAAATYYDRIELGEAVAAAFERIREEDADRLSARLRRVSLSERRLASTGTDIVLRAAYLVESSCIADLDEVVRKLGAALQGRVLLAYVGPLAPWDFVELDDVASDGRRTARVEARA